MNNIAIIPARSGSKGLKDKNIKPLNGKPLIAYSIEAAKNSGIFDCVHVSTDSREYAEIAADYGADVPFLRTDDLSSDSAGSWDVVKWVLNRYSRLGQEFDMLTLLQPTSPLRDDSDITAAYTQYSKGTGVKAVVSICEMDHSPLWSNTLAPDNSMNGFIKQGSMPRQALKPYYRINGAIYMVECSFLMEDINIYREGCYAYIMSKEKSIDIDTQFDFDMAEFLIKSMHLR